MYHLYFADITISIDNTLSFFLCIFPGGRVNFLHFKVLVLTVDNWNVKKYLYWSRMGIYIFMSWKIAKILRNLKASKGSLRRKNMNTNCYVYCCIIGCHGNTVAFGLNKKYFGGLFGVCVGGGVFWNLLYFDDNRKLDDVILYTVISQYVKYLR